MRKTYAVENASIHIVAPDGHPVDVVNAAGDWTPLSPAGEVLGRDAHFRTSDAAKLAEYDHLVGVKYLSCVNEEPDYHDPEPIVVAPVEDLPDPEPPTHLALKTFTLHVVAEAALHFMSHDMKHWEPVSGVVTFHHGVKIRMKEEAVDDLEQLISGGFIQRHKE
jgi:hypothetical protein